MAKIVIHDLRMNNELDQNKMSNVVGGLGRGGSAEREDFLNGFKFQVETQGMYEPNPTEEVEIVFQKIFFGR